MSPVIQAVLLILQTVSPALSNSQQVQGIITALVQIIPVLVKEFQDLVPMVKNIIAALSENPATTDQQLATLKELDAKVDADFEAAAQAAQAEDSQ